MPSLNKVLLIGNVGSDPELRHTPAGQAVASFSLATNEKFGGRDGQSAQERTEWHKVVAWGRLGEICNEYLRKGKPVYIEGRIQTRQWQDKDGNKRNTTEIVALQMQMLGGRESGGESVHRDRPAGTSYQAPAADPQPGEDGFSEDDSDLPFRREPALLPQG